jgi:hypothetical protein
MNKHFAYLLEDDQDDFFQKAAEEEARTVVANALGPPQHQIEKTAAPLEKFASRLVRDLEIIKTAGDCGLNLGMVRRTDDYMDALLARDDLVEGFEGYWDKMAAAAIETDMEAARQQLYEMVEPDWYPEVDKDIAEIGTDLVKAAQMDKEALVGVWRTLKAGKAALKGTKGLGAATRAKAVAGAPAQAWREARAARKAKATSKAWKKTEKAQAKYKKVRAAQADRIVKARSIENPALRARVVPGVEAKAAKKVQKASGKLQKKTEKLEKKRGALASASEKAYGPAKGAKGAKETRGAKETKGTKETKETTAPGEAPAATPATPPAAATVERNERLAAAAAKGEKPAFGDVFGKWRDAGYKTTGMSEKELQVLKEGGALRGAGAFLGYKLLFD